MKCEVRGRYNHRINGKMFRQCEISCERGAQFFTNDKGTTYKLYKGKYTLIKSNE